MASVLRTAGIRMCGTAATYQRVSPRKVSALYSYPDVAEVSVADVAELSAADVIGT